jgi:hypothetical protein
MIDPADELAILKIAYENCLNDLARTKAHLRQAEDTLFLLADLLHNKALDVQIKRVDNPGSSYLGR